MTAGRGVHLGTFDSERWWRPEELATLPAVGGGSAAAIEMMDELLGVFCLPDDLLVTRRPMSRGVLGGLADAGVGFEHRSVRDVDGVAETRTLERLVLGDDELLDTVSGYDFLNPYSVLGDTVALADRLNWSDQLPALPAVMDVNSKTWSDNLVGDLGLPGGGRVVRSVEELSRAVRELDYHAVVKDPFGVSGRGTLDIVTAGVLAAVERTVHRQVAAGRRVEFIVQEKYAKRTDFSGHLMITARGTWEWLGVQVMDNRGFRYLGSAPASADFLRVLEREGYPSVLDEVAGAVAEAGYWGPIGVDSMVLESGELIPVLEINSRQSLGLLTMYLDRRVADHGLRCHLWQIDLTVDRGRGIDDLCAALRGARALYRGGPEPGLVVLSGSGLSAPGGRVFFASICEPGDTATWRHRALAAVEGACMRPRGRVDAA